ncbi:MAG: hypothetical protein KDA90_20850, partial [Planctomycetaceae bacterium]|nr:hypothetical protein [Planctomycetaceae bacterium]
MLRPTRTHWLNSLLVHLPIVVALLWTPESWFIAWGTNPILSTQGTQVELSAEANPATPQAAQTMTPQSVFKYAGELLRGSLDSSPASAEQTTPNVPSPLDNASGPQASPAAAQSTLGLSDGNEVSAAAQVAFSPTEGGQEFPGYQLLGLTSEDIDRLRATGDAMVVVALDRRPFLVEGPLASPQVRPVALSALAGFSERRLYLPSALSRSVQESFR